MMIFTLICTWNMGLAQYVQQVEWNCSKNEFQLVEVDENLFKVEAIEPSYYYLQEAGQPALPLRSLRVLVPHGAVLEDFNYELEEEVISDFIALSVGSTPVPTKPWVPGRTHPDKFHGSFGDQPVVYQSTMAQRGFTWFSFSLSPFRYDSESGTLSLVRSIQLELSYHLNEDMHPAIYPDDLIMQMLKDMVLNPGDMDRFYPREMSARLKSGERKVDYLLITSEELKDAFTPLIHWKIRKGLKTEVITVGEIDAAYDEKNIQLKIKRCIYDYYTRTGLKWVLLGGDDGVVPVQNCYGLVDLGNGVIIDHVIPADLYYACFDRRFDWNANQDEKIGQLFIDDLDLVPEVFLSRIPVKSMEEVSIFVQKTLSYETNQPIGNSAGKLLLSGVKSWSQWEGKSDNHHRSEYVFNKHIPKNWTGKRIGFYDTGTDFPGDHEFQVTSPNLIALLNEGVGVFHFAGHGNRNSLIMEQGVGFNTKDALSLTNPYIGAMLTTVCDAGAYDEEDLCLSEALLTNPDGGCITFFGSTRLGFGNPNETLDLGPSFQYNSRFIQNLYRENSDYGSNSFARIASIAKSEFVNIGTAGGSYHYLQYAINPMGDPELPVYARDPDPFDNVRISRFENTLMVNTGGVKGSTICLTSLDLNEEYQVVAESVSYHTFQDIPEAFQVTITGPDRIPYSYVTGNVTGIRDDLSRYIRCYPNPVDDFLYVDMDITEGRLELYDLQGKLLLTVELSHGTHSIPMSAYPDGTYLLRILANQGNTRFKLLKQTAR